MRQFLVADPVLALAERSGLLSAERLDPYAPPEGHSTPPREDTAARLVADGLLTPYQARLILGGWHRGFFISEKYKILESLGEGGMGRVYLCEQLILERMVAVKQLQLGADAVPGAVERFLREAVAVAALDHPNICRIYDADHSGEGPYLVMEYVDGVNLHQLIVRSGQLPPGRAANLVRQAALGLQHAHEKGLVHRDIKPGNLMLDRSGTVKVLDMGLARFFDARRNQNLTRRFDARNILGTAEFIAPEQAINSSEVDTRADIYALGCTFYFLLLGRFPFEDGTALEKLKRHQTDAFDPVTRYRADVPAGLLAVLDKMVAKSPKDRYATPAELARALAPFDPGSRPPDAAELPPAETYRLGLCPPPLPGAVGSGLVPAPSATRAIQQQSTVVSRRGHDRAPAPSTPPAGGPIDFLAAPSGRGPGAGWMTPTGFERPPSGTPAPSAPRRRPRPWLWALGAAAVAVLGVLAGGVGTRLLAPRPAVPPPAAPDPATLAAPALPGGVTLAGSGSTFATPLLDLWMSRHALPGGRQFDYKAIGSTRGVNQMVEHVVDFACTEVPMTDAQLESAKRIGGEVQHLPLFLGAVVPVYNVPGAAKPLRFTGANLADIYLGRITNWNDDAIRLNNPGAGLPDLAITVVQRQEGSGTSYLFTDFLGRSSSEWQARVGAKSEPAWPKPPAGPPQALLAAGNDGVAAAVARTAGAVGYLELTCAAQNGLAHGQVKNRAGRFADATPESMAAAMTAKLPDLPADLRFSLVDAPGEGAWPICGVTFAVCYERQTPAKAEALRGFFKWALTDGQTSTRDLRYAPLPRDVVASALAGVQDIQAPR